MLARWPAEFIQAVTTLIAGPLTHGDVFSVSPTTRSAPPPVDRPGSDYGAPGKHVVHHTAVAHLIRLSCAACFSRGFSRSSESPARFRSALVQVDSTLEAWCTGRRTGWEPGIPRGRIGSRRRVGSGTGLERGSQSRSRTGPGRVRVFTKFEHATVTSRRFLLLRIDCPFSHALVRPEREHMLHGDCPSPRSTGLSDLEPRPIFTV
jgi:hypothetical protein